jgi:hypothetical protein
MKIHIALGIDAAHRVNRAGDTGRAGFVGRDPAIELCLQSREAGGIGLAGSPSLLQLRIGEFVDMEMRVEAIGSPVEGRQKWHADRPAFVAGHEIARQILIAIISDAGMAVRHRLPDRNRRTPLCDGATAKT